MRYAGFLPRLGAILIDSLLFVPIIAVSLWTWTDASRTTAILVEVPLASAFAFYNIYFIGRWGQTVGKMALKIRVVQVDGGSAGFVRAFCRHSIDLIFSVVTSALTIYALMSLTDGEYGMFTLAQRVRLVEMKTGARIDVLNWLSIVWVASELIVLLLNEKRRALHDYIAGTVVIHASEVPVAV
jgi:uncharacterized RDD family membrane protein YckC